MQNELIITEHEMLSRFQGERDLVTYAPYHIGDRVVRCGRCHCVVKSEYAQNGCPLCGSTPFFPIPITRSNNTATSSVQSVHQNVVRSKKYYLLFLLLSACVALLPFFSSDLSYLVYEATYGLETEWCFVLFGLVSFGTVLYLYFSKKYSIVWQREPYGFLLAFVPMLAPYLILAGIWLAILVLSIVFYVIAIIICVAVFIGIIAGSSD